jgi:hypothetical protein
MYFQPHLVHETTGLQNDRSMSSIGSYSIQHSPGLFMAANSDENINFVSIFKRPSLFEFSFFPNGPEIAVKTLNKIALNEQEQDSDVILPRSKKIRYASSPCHKMLMINKSQLYFAIL